MTTIAIIGVGVVGERIIQQALQLPQYEIVGIFDEQRARLEEMALQYEVPSMASLEELLNLQADWVYVGTPPKTHAALTKQIAAKGLHILCEKPLAHDAQEAAEMCAAVKAANVHSAMHFPMMYSSALRAVKRALQEGQLGEVLKVELQANFPHWPRPWQQNPWIASREQGGFIREIFPHYLQMTEHLFGDIAIQFHRTDYPSDATKSELGVVAIAEIEQKIPLVLSAMMNVGEQEIINYKIYGTKKTMTIRNWSELWVSRFDEPEQQLLYAEKTPSLLENCASLLRGEEALIVPFTEGLKVQHWIDELLQ